MEQLGHKIEKNHQQSQNLLNEVESSVEKIYKQQVSNSLQRNQKSQKPKFKRPASGNRSPSRLQAVILWRSKANAMETVGQVEAEQRNFERATFLQITQKKLIKWSSGASTSASKMEMCWLQRFSKSKKRFRFWNFLEMQPEIGRLHKIFRRRMLGAGAKKCLLKPCTAFDKKKKKYITFWTHTVFWGNEKLWYKILIQW